MDGHLAFHDFICGGFRGAARRSAAQCATAQRSGRCVAAPRASLLGGGAAMLPRRRGGRSGSVSSELARRREQAQQAQQSGRAGQGRAGQGRAAGSAPPHAAPRRPTLPRPPPAPPRPAQGSLEDVASSLAGKLPLLRELSLSGNPQITGPLEPTEGGSGGLCLLVQVRVLSPTLPLPPVSSCPTGKTYFGLCSAPYSTLE